MTKGVRLFMAASLLMLAGAGCSGTASTDNATTDTSGTTPTPAAQGRAVFTVTDDSSPLAGVSAVVITVDHVDVHSAQNGWITVSSDTKTYDLLKLKATGVSSLLADANLAADTYDQVRLNISKATVTVNGKTSDAKLPSNALKIVGNLTIAADQTSTASLDFQVDKSLHLTGSGTYVLAPVVRLQTTDDASVSVKADDSVTVTGGTKETDETVGEDVNGDVKSGFVLPAKLDVDASGHIIVKP
jgi:hypothetical protein